jgi:hypothetical protein
MLENYIAYGRLPSSAAGKPIYEFLHYPENVVVTGNAL